MPARSRGESESRTPGRVTFLLLPALAMGVGWGLRGYIGGGPLGAMIPGALTALSLTLLLGFTSDRAALAAAFGAIGIGFGGEMTYGETVGLISKPETFWWGFTGLSVKGAVWGLLGGAVLATGLANASARLRDLQSAAIFLVLGTAAGWRLVDVPRLVYFSAGRHEVWAGLLAGGALWAGFTAWRGRSTVPLLFALLGAAGGGAGFGLGGSWLGYARMSGLNAPIDSWKLMEFTFGACFGLALGVAALVSRHRLQPEGAAAEPARGPGRPAETAAAVTVAVALLAAESYLPLRFSYTAAGALLLCFLPGRPWLAWQTAVTLTVTAFVTDLAEFACRQWESPPGAAVWGTAAIASAICAWFVSGRRRCEAGLAAGFLLRLLWAAVLCSIVKSLVGFPVSAAHALVELTFVAGAVAITVVVRGFDSAGRLEPGSRPR